MPGLSVDLDLVFPDHTLPRAPALARINEAIRQAADRLNVRGFQVRTVRTKNAGETTLLVAALDRQHPRDLFDVMQLYENEGITPAIRRAFVVHLASHNRPVHEVLSPVLRDINFDFERTFKGMMATPVDIAALLATRERLVRDLQENLDAKERRFLLSMVGNAPERGLLAVPHLEQLPAIRWKMTNLRQLAARNPKKFAEQVNAWNGCCGS